MRTKATLLAMGAVLAAAPGCGKKSVRALVPLEYRVAALKGLPPGVKRLAIVPVQTSGNKQWSQAAARRLESRLMEVRDANRPDLEIVDQASFKRILAQKDLMLAGLVEPDEAVKGAKLANVQAMIVGAVAVKIDKQVIEKTTIKGISAAAGHRWGAGSVRTGKARGVRRTITIDVNFKLIDGANGTTWDSMTKSYQQTDEKTPSLLFGSSKTEGDMQSSDVIISNMIDRAVMDFITRMFPYTFTSTVPIKSGKSEASDQGVRLAAAGDYQAAAGQLAAAVAETPDDAKTLFAYAVVLQAAGDYDRALSYYRRALALDDDNKLYAGCVARLEAFKDRLVKQ